MKLNNYSLKVKNKQLVDNCDLNFYLGQINHIVGKNGVGKSLLAKDFLLNNSGNIPNVNSGLKMLFYGGLKMSF
ncbi:ABC transporter ATP-binding protein, partial [Staphylococcus aureus]